MGKKKEYMDKNCVICDKVFTAVVSNKRGRNVKTCGDRKCEDKLRLQTTYQKSCTICNSEYISTRINSKFCSEKCRRKRHTLKCEICDTSFFADRKEIRFCSIECQMINKKQELASVECDYCSCLITRDKSHIFKSQNNFCDATCSNNFWALELFSGKSKYGGKWGTTRKNTLEYYNCECQKCYKKITLKNCNIHHIIPIKYYGEDIDEANSIENLIPLCIDCHKNVHINNNKWYEEIFGKGKFRKI